MQRLIFDASPLITACKFRVRGQLVLDHLLATSQIIIPPSVQSEVVISSHQFADAQEAEQRISAGVIDVITPATVSGNVPTILGLYGLGNGERDAILLTYRTDLDGAWLVMDDYLGYLVSDRLGVKKLFLLDLIPRLVTQSDLDRVLATEIVEATRPRYAPAFVEHSLLLLK
jgi:predicted nucleic acid-binding protein